MTDESSKSSAPKESKEGSKEGSKQAAEKGTLAQSDVDSDKTVPSEQPALDQGKSSTGPNDLPPMPAPKKSSVTSAADSESTAVEDSATQNSADPESKSAEAEPQSAPRTVEPQAAKAKGGRSFIAFFALLLALIALGGAGYLYYLLIYLDPAAEIAQRDQAAAARLDTAERSIAELGERQQAELEAFSTQQQARLKAAESGVRESLQEALLAAPPSQREWKLAEAEYLMRIANHRALMEQDSVGARTLLEAADAVLAELDDFALYEIRARLADEILALKAVPRSDLQGVYLRLEALKGRLNGLTIASPEHQLAPTAAASEEANLWQQFTARASEFIRVRELAGEETLRPLLAPQQEAYLELNMRLALEQAQLAALKRQQPVFEQALSNLRDWLSRYFAEDAQPLIAEVDELLSYTLETSLPDISGSLNDLLEMRGVGQ